MNNQIFKLGKLPSGLLVLNHFISLTTFHVTAAVGLAGSALASRSARKSAQGAAAVQASSEAAAQAEQRRQFDITQAQAEPFRQAELRSLERGEPFAQEQTAAAREALTQRRALTGLGTPEEQAAAFEQLQASPGQAFLRDRQEQALLRNQAAIGGLGGGNVRTALQQQATGFAQQDLQNQLARLQGFAPGAALGTGTTQNLAIQGANVAQNIGGSMRQAGQAQAGGILGAGAARSRFAQQAGGMLMGGAASGFGGPSTVRIG